MSPERPPADPQRFLTLARTALGRPGSPFTELPGRLVLVDVESQRLALLIDGRVAGDYAVSTASAGIGGEEGSLRTPPGWHRVHARIGAGQPSGAVFASREPTGEIWRGEGRPEDLILSRILTLEGLEESVNRGPGRDSLDRYIYIHGTNHEEALGSPASHGCVRMANAHVLELFDRVQVGDPVVVTEPRSAIPDPLRAGRFHYAGLGGSGMSALAQFQVMLGGIASGSDRAFDRGERTQARAQLEALGIAVHAQDGSGLEAECAALVLSSAVEDQVPDVSRAKAAGVPIVHRSELLAHFVASFRTIAVAGTSGKSTVVAMVFEILRGAGRAPSVITGGDLELLREEGLWGNAWFGGSDLLVVEADESDGSVVRYHAAIGLVTNLQKDHKDEAQVAGMFETFRRQAREAFVVGEEENLRALAGGAIVFGFGPRATVRGSGVALAADSSRFEVDGVTFRLPVPGRHNVENALAAIAACHTLGVPLEAMIEPLARFRGVGRRFQSLGRANGVEVVDDFAHNPAKLRAAIETAAIRVGRSEGSHASGPGKGRVLAVYQPHGYGPTRFLRPDFVATFATALAPEDRLWLLEIYYAGGTAQRDFSAADIVAEVVERGIGAEFAPSREALVRRIAEEARPGDLVLVMGARDPSLTDLSRSILEALAARAPRADRAPVGGTP